MCLKESKLWIYTHKPNYSQLPVCTMFEDFCNLETSKLSLNNVTHIEQKAYLVLPLVFLKSTADFLLISSKFNKNLNAIILGGGLWSIDQVMQLMESLLSLTLSWENTSEKMLQVWNNCKEVIYFMKIPVIDSGLSLHYCIYWPQWAERLTQHSSLLTSQQWLIDFVRIFHFKKTCNFLRWLERITSSHFIFTFACISYFEGLNV